MDTTENQKTYIGVLGKVRADKAQTKRKQVRGGKSFQVVNGLRDWVVQGGKDFS